MPRPRKLPSRETIPPDTARPTRRPEKASEKRGRWYSETTRPKSNMKGERRGNDTDKVGFYNDRSSRPVEEKLPPAVRRNNAGIFF